MFEKLAQTIADIMEQRFHVDEMRLLPCSDSKKLASFPERITFGAASVPAIAPMMTLSRLPFQKREDVFQLLFRFRTASFSPAAEYL